MTIGMVCMRRPSRVLSECVIVPASRTKRVGVLRWPISNSRGSLRIPNLEDPMLTRLSLYTFVACLLTLCVAPQPTRAQTKEVVTGIGGVFFKAQNPQALAEWYEKNLGIARTPTTYDQQPWMQLAGPTVFAPFTNTTTHFGRAEQQWMINFRVRDLDAMVRQLREAGIEVTVDPTVHPNGRFARLSDPEGNPIELWEPIMR